MTTLTLDNANDQLAAAGIRLRLSLDGLASLNKNELFHKAMNACVRSQRARQDVLSFLDHLRNQNNGLVYNVQQDQNQPPSAPVSNAPTQQQAPAPAPQQQPQQSHPDEPPASAPDTTQTEDRVFINHHVYGGKAALDFKISETRRDSDPTIAIDGAPALARNKYDWSKKTTIQITLNDLPSVAAVFFGLLKEVELRHYGANNDKSLKLQHQGDKVFINMFAKDFAVQVPVFAGDAFQVRNLFLRQLLAKHPEVGVEGILANLKCHASMLRPAQTQR
jgi:hypothetical protein